MCAMPGFRDSLSHISHRRTFWPAHRTRSHRYSTAKPTCGNPRGSLGTTVSGAWQSRRPRIASWNYALGVDNNPRRLTTKRIDLRRSKTRSRLWRRQSTVRSPLSSRLDRHCSMASLEVANPTSWRGLRRSSLPKADPLSSGLVNNSTVSPFGHSFYRDLVFSPLHRISSSAP